jgi:hypothetical protein
VSRRRQRLADSPAWRYARDDHRNKRPTQQIGIIPGVVVRPALAGFRAGRDEVLEAGVSHALGRGFRLPK